MDKQHLRILLVDDDEDDYIITRDLLAEIKDTHFDLEWVDTYNAAWIVIKQNRHDVYLFDYRLGGQTGLELLRDTVASGCNAPIILLTGQGDRAIDLEAMKSGAADYLVKGQIDAPLLERSIRYAIEHKQVAEAVQRVAEQRKRLLEISQSILSTLTLDEIIERIEQSFQNILKYDTCGLYWFDEEAGLLRPSQVVGPAWVIKDEVIPAGKGIMSAVLHSEKGELVNNAHLDPRSFYPPGAKVEREHLISIPLRTTEKTLGVFQISRQADPPFTNEEFELAQLFVALAANAIENARLHTETKKRAQQLAVLHELDRAITTSLRITDIYHAFTQHAIRLLPYDYTCITLLKGNELCVTYAANNKGALVPGTTLLGKTSSPSRVVIQGQPIIHHNLTPEDRQLWDEDIQSSLIIPLRVKGQVIGTWNIGSKLKGGYGPDDLDIAQSMADQLAIAIENAHLFEQAKQEIAERKRIEVTRAKLEEQLRQSQKMEAIGTLAGGIAHDFNNLLTAIMGYAGLSLADMSPDDPHYHDIQGIQKTAERATDLTRQLLAFARRQMVELRLVNLNELILNMGKMLRRLIGEDIELVTLPAPDLGLVKVDPGQFEQVLVNLAVNARDAMPNGGKLTIETANVTLNWRYIQNHAEVVLGEYVLLAVSDNGTGMTDEIKEHVFEPFFTTKEVNKGTGLGLATCFGIVKQSGGHIWLYSEAEHGTTFKIYLPRIPEAKSSSPFQQENMGNLPRGDETVLLVEDEDAVRDLAARLLRQQGYNLIEAANGNEALQLIQQGALKKIDLIVTDVVMPQMSGKALADQLKVMRPEIKILFTSGYTDHAIVHHGVLEPGLDFLQKPFSPEMLMRKVREVLDKPPTA